MQSSQITGFPFSVLSLSDSVAQLADWARDSVAEGRCIAVVNPHSVEAARRDPEFAAAIRAADMVTPDGIGIVLASRILGAGIPERVCGPDLFVGVCERLNAEQAGTRMFFLGSSPENLVAIEQKLGREYPNLLVAGTYSPPYKPEFSDEDIDEMVALVNASNSSILWIGLGAPKQEKLAQRMRARLNVNVIAPVGGVFDFYTGRIKLPPRWVQRMGLIFLFRFFQEPRRLLRRNLDSPLFLWHVVLQRVGVKSFNAKGSKDAG